MVLDVKTDTARRPPKEQRDALRRDEIITAARHCFVRHGFHAASMHSIAGRAAMSVGQIYRYFSSKEAIIQTIVQGIAAKRLARMPPGSCWADMARKLASRFLPTTPEDEEDDVLLLEIVAEATRNPEVAAIVREYDGQLRSAAASLLRREYPSLSEREVLARAEFMAVLIHGTKFRRGTELAASQEVLGSLYRRAIDAVLPVTGS
jgi:AcrR family transcriptional regulator